jgi:hypothetical protein
MTDVAALRAAYPGTLPQADEDALVVCIQETVNCAQACIACADACSAYPSAAHLAQCAGSALNCADLATAVVRVLSRPTAWDHDATVAALWALEQTLRVCYRQCQKHAMDIRSCEVCADACLRCGQRCKNLLRSLE